MNSYAKILSADSIQFERLLPGPLERVWAYLVEPDKRAKWLAGGAMELKPGGKVELVFNNNSLGNETAPEKYTGKECFRVGNTITECKAPTYLSMTWAADGYISDVSFALTEQNGKVLLTVTHNNVKKRADIISFSGGWHTHLDILSAILNNEAAPPFWSTHAKLEGEYEKRIA